MINNSHQNSKYLTATSASELPWLAFCYVANELDAEMRREFEIRLEHDQSAREAVAQAFDNAWMLDQALAQEVNELPAAVCELPRKARSRARKSKSAWPTALLGIAIAGLLATLLLQVQWKPAEVEVAKNTGVPASSELTNTSMSLAETWADSDWDPELEAEIANVQPESNQLQQSAFKQELAQDDEQDDWMTATLIDMGEDLDVFPHQ